MKNLTFFLFAILLWGCAEVPVKGVAITEKNYSLAEIRHAITAIAGEPRELSQNMREYKTQYFSRKTDPKFNFETAPERVYAHFLILGERRPFEIRIIVQVERKTKGGYALVGEDKVWADRIRKELMEKLHQGRENRNLIDDFKSF